MTLESPEDLMRQMVAWMAIMLVAAMYSVYVLFHLERESKRMLANYKAWSPHKPIVDEPAEIARIRQRIIIFCAVVLAVCVLVDLRLGMALIELRNRIQVAEQAAVTAQTHPSRPDTGATVPATPNNEAHVLPSKQPSPRAQKRTGQAETPMVLVPGGTFWMGISDDERDRAIEDCKIERTKQAASCKGWVLSAQPRHQVTIDPFHLDPYEVTNRQFEQFVQATVYQTTAEKEGTAFVWTNNQQGWQQTKGATWRQPEAGPDVFASDRVEHPVVNVSWNDAEAYCRWAGKRLPTEAEFEYATRAGTQTTYWWGNFSPGLRQVANVADENARTLLLAVITGYEDGAVTTAPVGSYDANPFGLFDMTGNVAEWTADRADGLYYRKSPERNPTGPSSGGNRMFRGGAWSDASYGIRPTVRDEGPATERGTKLGFRCAQDRPK